MIPHARLPGEFEAHAATWVAWPHNQDTWPGCLAQAESEFGVLVTHLAESEPVRILVKDEAHAETVQAKLRELPPGAAVEFHPVPTDDAWLRDTGPSFVRDGNAGLLALDWSFNAWGGKYPPWDRDDAVASQVAQIAGAHCLRPGLVAEGGAFEVDGAGTLIATEPTLIDPARNPGVDREELERRLGELLGVRRIIWLGAGIEGDDTDGHVDDIARFVAPGRVVCAREPDPADPNHAPLEDCRARLAAARDAAGRAFELIDLPMPSPIESQGQRLPASYANFYIANRAVLVPVFGVPEDAPALDLIQAQFRNRKTVAIPASALVRGLGTVHCLTQQEPVRKGDRAWSSQ